MTEFEKKFPKPEFLIINIDATNEICRLIHEKKRQGWLEALKWVVGHLEITEKSNSKIWTEIEELEKKGE